VLQRAEGRIGNPASDMPRKTTIHKDKSLPFDAVSPHAGPLCLAKGFVQPAIHSLLPFAAPVKALSDPNASVSSVRSHESFTSFWFLSPCSL
jgi:hypothetical protein